MPPNIGVAGVRRPSRGAGSRRRWCRVRAGRRDDRAGGESRGRRRVRPGRGENVFPGLGRAWRLRRGARGPRVGVGRRQYAAPNPFRGGGCRATEPRDGPSTAARPPPAGKPQVGALVTSGYFFLPWFLTASIAAAAASGSRYVPPGFSGLEVGVEFVGQRDARRDVEARDVGVGDAVEVLDQGAQAVAVGGDQDRAAGQEVGDDAVEPVREHADDDVLQALRARAQLRRERRVARVVELGVLRVVGPAPGGGVS